MGPPVLPLEVFLFATADLDARALTAEAADATRNETALLPFYVV